jgi:HAD superfamily hydrolase (TIGR01549 family)
MATSGAVVFDAGETLFNEERSWREWAKWLDVPPERLLTALDEAIQQRRHHKTAFEALRSDLTFEQQRQQRFAEGFIERFTPADLFPDALSTIKRLKDGGYLVGVVGNHPRGMPDVLRELEPRIDFIASSDAWGTTKPDPEFFRRVVKEVAMPPSRIAYVGDRLDNDVLPAIELGMLGVFLRRGRWGNVHRTWPEAAKASAQIDALDELPNLLPDLLPRQ